MRFFSLAVVASVLAIAQAAPTSGSCYNIKDGSGYLTVVKGKTIMTRLDHPSRTHYFSNRRSVCGCQPQQGQACLSQSYQDADEGSIPGALPMILFGKYQSS